MQFAFMSFSTPALTLGETLALAGRLGYAGIEPRTDRNHGHGIELERTPAERGKIARLARESGVAICCLASGLRVAAPGREAAVIEETLRHIELAHDIGAPQIRVFGGPLGEGVSREAAVEAASTVFRAVAPTAAAAGVCLCMETHDAWCHPADVAEVMQQVGHPAIGVNWDVMHPQRTAGVSVGEAFALLRPWIIHTHIHDGLLEEPLRIVPCGEGEIDLPAFFTALRSIGYGGFVSGEWPDCENMIDLGDELRRMQEAAR